MDNRIVGVHAVYEALTSSRQPIERIHIAREAHSGKVKELLDLARERGVPVRKEERSILDRMAQGQIHQGVGSRCSGKTFSAAERYCRQGIGRRLRSLAGCSSKEPGFGHRRTERARLMGRRGRSFGNTGLDEL